MQYSKEEKAMRLEDWRRSGKSAWAYAKENGIVPQTFCMWAKREAKTMTGFAEVTDAAMRSVSQTPEILIEYGNIKIHIPMAVMEGLRGAQ